MLAIPVVCVERGLFGRRDALVAAAVAATALPRAASGAGAWPEQERLLQRHAARFPKSSNLAVHVGLVEYNGGQIRQLVATVDLPANTRVASYPVELMPDATPHDTTYAVEVYQELRLDEIGSSDRQCTPEARGRVRGALEGISGLPTEKSLAPAFVDGLPTVALFSNEPDTGSTPNCLFLFPKVDARSMHLAGTVHCGYLQTTKSVKAGAPLTWCYGPSYWRRVGYESSCTWLAEPGPDARF